MAFSVGVGVSTREDLAEQAVAEAQITFPGEAQRQDIKPLAGPNHVLQLIGDPEDWRRLAQLILQAVGTAGLAGAGIFVAGALQEAGKDAWRNRARALSLVRPLV